MNFINFQKKVKKNIKSDMTILFSKINFEKIVWIFIKYIINHFIRIFLEKILS